MRTKIYLILLLALYSNALGFAGRRSETEPTPSPTPIVQTSPTASPAPSSTPSTGALNVEFTTDPYYSTPKEREMIAKAGKKMNEVVQGKCFKDFMTARKMIQTDGRSSAQVVEHLQNLKGKVKVIVYFRAMKSKWNPFGTTAVAFREPPSTDINLNRAYFSVDDPVCDWAGTMGHESLGHSLGEYDHDYEWNSKRDFSVPYSIAGSSENNNDAFQECCSE